MPTCLGLCSTLSSSPPRRVRVTSLSSNPQITETSAQLDSALRAVEGRDQRGRRPGSQRKIEAQLGQDFSNSRLVRVLGPKRDERQALRRGGRGMRGGAPVDEKRNEAVGEIDTGIRVAPGQQRSIGTLSFPVADFSKRDALTLGLGGEHL